MSTDLLHIGLIGAGAVARLHVDAVNAADGARIVAVADVRADAAETLARRLGARAFTDYTRLLDMGQVDAVVIAVPPHVHVTIGLSALAAGKHVFIEKPLTLRLAEAQRFVDEARRASGIVMVCHNLLFHPAVEFALTRLRDGVIGRPTAADAWATGYLIPDPHDFRLNRKAWQDGAWLDAGVHLTYTLEAFLGAIEAGTAYQQIGPSRLGGPEASVAALRHSSGALSTARVSYSDKVPGWDDPWPGGWRVGFSIHGDAGALRVEVAPSGRVLTYSGHGDWTLEHASGGVAESFGGAMREFIAAAKDRRPPRAGTRPTDGLHVLEVLYASLGRRTVDR